LSFGGSVTGGWNSTINCCQVNSSGGFNSTTGSASFAAGVSQTTYTFAAGNVQQGFVAAEAPSPNNSTTLAFCDSLAAGNAFVAILAREGNVNTGTTNVGTVSGGTYNMNVNLFCNSSGNLRLSVTSNGTANWSIIFT
jgi:hypothetical protein